MQLKKYGQPYIWLTEIFQSCTKGCTYYGCLPIFILIFGQCY